MALILQREPTGVQENPFQHSELAGTWATILKEVLGSIGLPISIKNHEFMSENMQ